MKLIEYFNGIPSLEFSIATRVVITIWNRDDIVHSITQYLDMDELDEHDIAWNEIAHRVITTVRNINDISNVSRRNIEALITPIGFHIREMRTFLNLSPYIASSDLEFPVSHWTSYGTVNTKRLEEILMRDSTKDIGFRYNLACNACIETVVEELFSQLTSEQKGTYLNLERHRELLSYWTNRLLDQLSHFENLIRRQGVRRAEVGFSADQIAFRYTLSRGNKSGIEYFLNYLRPNDSEIVLQNCFVLLAVWPMFGFPGEGYLGLRPREHYADALYFLLSKMSENRRNQFLSQEPYAIWNSFLTYPFYGMFCEHAKEYMNIYTNENILFLIKTILKLYSVDNYFYGYEPFWSLWENCSQTKQNYVNSQRNELIQWGGINMVKRLDDLIHAQGN